jgi:hypothetical protein
MQMFLGYAADILLMTASLGAAAYCMILSRLLRKLGSFDKGIGSAIAVMSAQVEEMKTALGEAKAGSDGAGRHLNDLVQQAREISSELEMMIAACHDFAETAIEVQSNAARGPEAAERAGERATTRQSDPGPDARAFSASHGGGSQDQPVFGSRRIRAGEAEAGSAAEPVAVFRHRKTADA